MTPVGAPDALPTAFFERPAVEVARDLLGCSLMSACRGAISGGVIVETEAYTGPDDPACHAAARIGRTSRNEPLYGPPGTAYVHMNYGIHWLLNTVTGPAGYPAGVLFRAIEPTHGLESMRERRGREALTNGPARLAQALAVGPEVQGHRLDAPPVWLVRGEPVPDEHVEVTARIGISRAVERPLRFYDRRSRWVSRR
jgi:DNA-3-methyladenine glycosylase